MRKLIAFCTLLLSLVALPVAAQITQPYRPVIQTTTSTGTQNDFVLTSGANILYCNNASLLTFNGFVAGYDGQRLMVVSIGAGQVDLAHQNVGSVAANRAINFATSGNTSLAAGVGWAEYQYDATTARWRLIGHEQGAWITVTFAAGNFTANGSMTWTVDSGDVTTMAYYLRGRMLNVAWQFVTTTVGGTPNTQLLIGNGAYGGFTWVKLVLGNTLSADNGTAFTATTSTSVFQINAAGTSISIFKQVAANFTAGSNNCQISGELFAEVQ